MGDSVSGSGQGMTEERIKAYLLDELPQADREQFEEDCFAEKEWPAELIEDAEEELIHDYLRNELSPERRQRFEQNYLTTPSRFAMAALLRHIDESPVAPPVVLPPPKPTLIERLRAFWMSQSLPLGAAIAILVVTVITGVLYYDLSPRPPETFATVMLNISNSDRAEGAQAERIKLDADAIKAHLTVPQRAPQAEHYRVELEDERGKRESVEIVEQNSEYVVVVIPAAGLSRGLHALKLYAVGTDGIEQRIPGSYIFNVE